MSRPVAGSWVDHYEAAKKQEKRIKENAEASLGRRRVSSRINLPEVEVIFEDDFAPSRSVIGYEGPSIEGPSRSVLYGDDWSDIGWAAILRCTDFGLPMLLWPSLGEYSGLTERQHEILSQIWAECSRNIEEASEDWICLQVYFRLLALSRNYSENAPQYIIFEEIFRLGALVRELQLVNLNKADALGRRKQKKALVEGNAGRTAYNQERTRQAKLWKQLAGEIAKETSLNGNARSRWVSRQLWNRHSIEKAPSTVGKALRE